MFRASDASFLWSPSGAAVLVKTSTDVDATGQSYYGESKLAFMSADGKTEGSVALGKEGPIHDVAWSPAGREFVAIYGFMPAKATLFDVKARPATPHAPARARARASSSRGAGCREGGSEGCREGGSEG